MFWIEAKGMYFGLEFTQMKLVSLLGRDDYCRRRGRSLPSHKTPLYDTKIIILLEIISIIETATKR